MPDTTWRLNPDDLTMIAQLRKELLAYARGRTANTADAEDVLADTILAAGRNFEHRSTIRHYLFSVLKRRVGDYLRRKQRGAPWVGTADAGEAEFEQMPAHMRGLDTHLSWLRHAQRIDHSLDRIPLAYREVVRLAVHGHTNSEIADTLGLAYNTVRSRLSRGNAYLSKLMDEAGDC